MRQCLIEPISDLTSAAQLLDEAADALLRGDITVAAQLISRADIPAIMEYAMRIVGKLCYEVHRQTRLPATLPKDRRHPSRMPTQATERSIYLRDGWRCRFCETKVISRRARSKLIKAFPAETRWVSNEFERHSALYAMVVSLDHVVPHSRGGTNDPSNLVTSCFCCQFGRGQFSIEEVEVRDPRERHPVVDNWDGLTRLDNFKPIVLPIAEQPVAADGDG